MSDPVLTPEQEAEAQRLAELAAAKTKAQVLQMVRLLVSKKTANCSGRRNSSSATAVITWERSFCRPLWTSGKKGYQESSMTCPHCKH